MINPLSLYIVILLSAAVIFTWIDVRKRCSNKRSTIQVSRVKIMLPSVNYVVTYSEKLFAKDKWNITPEENHATYITTNTFLDGHKEAVVMMYTANILITSIFFPNYIALTINDK